MADWVDTSGSRPRLRAGAAATGVLATITVGWYAGLIEFLDGVGGGVTGALDDVSAWLAGDGGLVASIFGIPEGVLDAAAAENAAFVASFGVFAQVVAFAEGVFVFAAILVSIQHATRLLARFP